MTRRLAVLAPWLLCWAVVVSAAIKDPAAARCPVSDEACNPDVSVAFAGGKVWFCCGDCEAAFTADAAPFTAKAHHQLVATGQLKQKGCPFSGGPVKAGTQLDIEGVEVGFCCPNCKGKVEKAPADERVTMVFGNVAKGFEPAD
jgi:formylmethanofuran:tetrahydromethanopterin formyltransferase